MVHDQSLVIWKKTTFSVPTDVRFPGSRPFAHRLPGLPVAAPHGARWTLPHTVTRSHRLLTCFPFTPCPHPRGQRHRLLYSIFYSIPHPSAPVKKKQQARHTVDLLGRARTYNPRRGQSIVENRSPGGFLLVLPVLRLAASATGSARLRTS